jgi:Ca2+-binding RTX toxin-like protein
LFGGPGADRLFGGSDADVLIGEGGADRLVGGPGPDGLIGRSGGDRIAAVDGARDEISCGKGRDTARIDAKDRVHACEILRRRGYTSSG